MRRSSPITRWAWSGSLVVLLLAGQSKADDENDHVLRITNHGPALGETPMIVECKLDHVPSQFEIPGLGGLTAVRANTFREGGKTYLAAIVHDLPAKDRWNFQIPNRPSPVAPGAGVIIATHGRRIEVRVDGKLVTEYIPDDGPKPYFFPVIGPSGAPMTRSFPMKKVEGEKYDHPHHRSLWFTHGSVNKVDFWSEAPGHGRIVETSRPTVIDGLAMGTIRTTDDWLAPDRKKVCEDERVVRIYATKMSRVLDFDVTLKATEGPVTFGDTKEGMFGLRVPTSMDVTSKKGGKIVTAEGLEDKAAWGKPAAWVDYAGPVDGKTVGVAILNHPSSFRYPTTWHIRDYGLFAANPFGWHDFGQKTPGEFVLPKGESIRFRYRVILHDGDTASANLPAAFQGYAEPPKAVVE
jgi:hypothetical protein